MALDFSSDAGENWGLPVETMDAGYSTVQLSSGVPDNFVNAPRSDGITFTGIFDGIQATAETLGGIFTKAYQLNANVENLKFQRDIASRALDIQRSAQIGALDVKQKTIDATTAIELSRANRALADAQAQSKSGGTFYVPAPATVASLKKYAPVLMVAAGVVGVFIFLRGKK